MTAPMMTLDEIAGLALRCHDDRRRRWLAPGAHELSKAPAIKVERLHDARGRHIRLFDRSIIYFTNVKYSGIVQEHCADGGQWLPRVLLQNVGGYIAAGRPETN